MDIREAIYTFAEHAKTSWGGFAHPKERR